MTNLYGRYSLKTLEQLLLYFSTSLIGKRTEKEVVWDVAGNCVSKLGFEDCVIYLVDKSGKSLVQRAAFGGKAPMKHRLINRIKIKVGQGITGAVALSGVGEIVSDTSKDSRYIVDDAVRLSEIAVPIMVNNQVIGVIDCEHPDRNYFKSDHLQILNVVASICGMKIGWIRAQIAADREKLNAYKIQEQLAKESISAMYRQINPHFIFNYLTTIQASMLRGDLGSALFNLSLFSSFLRQIIANYNDDGFTKVINEFKLVELYLKLEAARSQNRLSATVNIGGRYLSDSLIMPSLFLFSIVENVLRFEVDHAKKAFINIDGICNKNQIVIKVKNESGGIFSNSEERISQWKGLKRRITLLKKAHGLIISLRVKPEKVGLITLNLPILST